MTPKPVTMWAVVASGVIDYCTIRPTEADAKQAALDLVAPHKDWLEESLASGKVRLARVVVAEEGGK